jgi:hypothetical protein
MCGSGVTVHGTITGRSPGLATVWCVPHGAVTSIPGPAAMVSLPQVNAGLPDRTRRSRRGGGM